MYFLIALMDLAIAIILMLLEKKSDVKVKDKNGTTPFSLFLDTPLIRRNSGFVLPSADLCKVFKAFVDCGADASSAGMELKRCVLHILARFSSYASSDENKLYEECQFYLQKGADADLQDYENVLPYESARGKVRKLLHDAWLQRRYSKLFKLKKVKPKKIKVCFTGDEGAGKTTLMNSLRRNKVKKPEVRTAGIDVVNAQIEEAGDLVLCDFAGQPNFHITHSLFFSESTTVYIHVIDVTKTDIELFDSSSYWFSFVKCSVGAASKHTVILVGSRRDKQGEGTKLASLITALRARFNKYFDVSNSVFLLDCRDENHQQMQHLRSHIAAIKARCIKSANEVPEIVENVQQILLPQLRNIFAHSINVSEALERSKLIPRPDLSMKYQIKIVCDKPSSDATEEPAEEHVFTNLKLSKEELYTIKDRNFLATNVFCYLIERNIYKGLDKETLLCLVRFLHDIGEVIEIDQHVIINPGWLCNSVIGPLMSPVDFPVHMEGVRDGIVTIERLQKVIDKYNGLFQLPRLFEDSKGQLSFAWVLFSTFSAMEAVKVLSLLEICYLVQNRETSVPSYCFPALISLERREELWAEDAEMEVYVGRRLECQNDTDIITPGTIPFLQTRSAVTLAPPPFIWKNGMVLEKFDKRCRVQGLIELQERERALDIVVRGPCHSEAECMTLLTEMINLTLKVKDERSPGTLMKPDSYLSTKELKKLTKFPPAHSEEAVSKAKTNRLEYVTTTLDNKPVSDSMKELSAVSSDHFCLLPRKVKLGIFKSLAKEDNDGFSSLVREIGMSHADFAVCGDSPEAALLEWSLSLNATVSKLLLGLRKSGLSATVKILTEFDPSFEQMSNTESPVDVRHVANRSPIVSTSVVEEHSAIERQAVTRSTKTGQGKTVTIEPRTRDEVEATELNRSEIAPTDVVTTRLIRSLYNKISHEWRRVARLLGPIPFIESEIKKIKLSDKDENEQCLTMLHEWCQKQDDGQGNVSDLLTALLDEDIGLADVATKVFGKETVQQFQKK